MFLGITVIRTFFKSRIRKNKPLHTLNGHHENQRKYDIGGVRHKHNKLPYLGMVVEMVKLGVTEHCCVGFLRV